MLWMYFAISKLKNYNKNSRSKYIDNIVAYLNETTFFLWVFFLEIFVVGYCFVAVGDEFLIWWSNTFIMRHLLWQVSTTLGIWQHEHCTKQNKMFIYSLIQSISLSLSLSNARICKRIFKFIQRTLRTRLLSTVEHVVTTSLYFDTYCSWENSFCF